MLVGLFDGQTVEVEAATSDLPDVEGDAVVLVEDGDVVAASPMAELERAILLVSPDLYTTGTRKLRTPTSPRCSRGCRTRASRCAATRSRTRRNPS